MTQEQFLKNLQVPNRVVDAVLDTDAYNEIDDQFALAYMMLCPERIRVLGITAAPFYNEKSSSPADGMEQSYREVLKILHLLGRDDFAPNVYRGSVTYLKNEQEPVASEAASYLVGEAKKHSPENPLYIVAIGAITNVASAILMDREAMTENTVIIWLGGHALHYAKPNTEFNLRQDIAGARVLFGCGVPLVQLPCHGVVGAFRTTRPELEYWLKGSNALGDYLVENTVRTAEAYAAGKPWSRVIWDVTAVAWLLNDDNRFMDSYLVSAPIPEYDNRWATDPNRPLMVYVYNIQRDDLMNDLFMRIRGFRHTSR